jgi:plasmid stabilization system protein ParE
VKYRVVITTRARADAVEAFRWLAERSPDAAARWYDGFQKAIAKLATMPERCPVAHEDSEQLGITLRQLLYGRRRGSIESSSPSNVTPSPSITSDTAPRGRSRIKRRLTLALTA